MELIYGEISYVRKVGGIVMNKTKAFLIFMIVLFLAGYLVLRFHLDQRYVTPVRQEHQTMMQEK